MSDNEVKVYAFFKNEQDLRSRHGEKIWTCISMKMVGDAVGLSEGQARYATQQLVKKGKLKSDHFLQDDCQPYSYMIIDEEEEDA